MVEHTQSLFSTHKENKMSKVFDQDDPDKHDHPDTTPEDEEEKDDPESPVDTES